MSSQRVGNVGISFKVAGSIIRSECKDFAIRVIDTVLTTDDIAWDPTVVSYVCQVVPSVK